VSYSRKYNEMGLLESLTFGWFRVTACFLFQEFSVQILSMAGYKKL